jgi:hypothetical protein
MRRLWDRIRPESDREATLLLGLVMLAVGLAFWWPPLSLIVPGAILTIVGILARPSGEVNQ